MFDNIPATIICSQFESILGYNRPAPQDDNDLRKAMQVEFSLHADYAVEDGYRHLKLLLFNHGMRYTGVYAKLDWNVIDNDNLTDEDDPHVKPGQGYVKGETPWVLLGYHDSCWRQSVEDVLRKHRDNISHVDALFNGKTGWYKEVVLTEEQVDELDDVRRNTPGYGNNNGERVKLEDLDFKFPAVEGVK